MRTVFRALSVVAGAALLFSASCAPAGDPILSLTAMPRDIADSGEETVIRIVATTSSGLVGKGTVELTSDAGAFVTPQTVTLDAYGTATVTFSCNVKLDPGCVGSVIVSAEWKDGGTSVTGQVAVAVTKPPNPWENGVAWDGAARSTSCSGVPAPQPPPCNNGMCPHGFGCVNDVCLLNGLNGGLQYTLRFTQPVDLDLHLVEPLADGGTCETFFGNPGRAPFPSNCGARASLDLDSNPSCVLDNVDTENIIFPRGKPAGGTFIARVDLYDACSLTTTIGWELQVRAGSIVRYYCGEFQPSEADMGNWGSGRTISTIQVPYQYP